MRHFYMIVNRDKENANEAANLICRFLEEQGCECVRLERDGNTGTPGPVGYRYTDRRQIPHETECVICLGGDGTLIQAARDLAGLGLPLFGVNMGHLGYLTQIGREEDIIPAMEELIGDHYRLESRMMLKGRVFSPEGELLVEDIALNDIVLGRMGKDAVRFHLRVNGQMFNEYSADGMIVATPTGSTAYNLSAGGPIAAPEAELMILTPTCPHTLNARSIVLAPDNQICLEVDEGTRSPVYLSFDGDTVVDLRGGARIEIERSQLCTPLIQLRQVSFLENIRNKMKQI